MKEARKREISHIIAQASMRKVLVVGEDIENEEDVKNFAKTTGIDTDEAREYLKEMLAEAASGIVNHEHS